MSRSQQVAVLLQVGLCVLLAGWYGWLRPPATLQPAIAVGLMLLPSAPGLLLGALRHRSAAFWCGVSCLFYFSHGVMEAWTLPSDRWLGAAEAVLASAVVVAASWDGVRARFARR
jgi:uncharacterized membrane protein